MFDYRCDYAHSPDGAITSLTLNLVPMYNCYCINFAYKYNTGSPGTRSLKIEEIRPDSVSKIWEERPSGSTK